MNKNKIAVIAAAAVLAGGATGFFMWDNADNFTGNRVSNSDHYSADFTRFNGEDVLVRDMQEGDSFTVNADITKGRVSISIALSGEDTGYKMSDIKSINDYVYTAEKDGEYTIKINAKHAAGSIEIRDGEA